LPLIDDSDNTVRQEAAKLLATFVYRNKDSTEVGPLVIDKLPAHRRTVFADEWRKIAKDSPCPALDMEQRVSTPASPSNGGRRASPGRQRPASPGTQRPASPRTQRPASPRTQRPPSPGPEAEPEKPSRAKSQPEGPTRAAQPSISVRPEPVATSASTPVGTPAAPETSDLVAQMAAEIKSLRCKVERMEKERTEVEKATPDNSSAAFQPRSRLRAPSGERQRAAGDLRAASGDRQRAASGDRQRAASGDRQRAASGDRHAPADRARPATPRRTREPSAERRDATPTRQRQPSAPRQVPSIQFGSALSPRLSAESNAAKERMKSGHGESHLASQEEPRTLGHNSSVLALHAEGAPTFRIDMPKQSRQARQHKEKSQYWGPEQIPAEYLSLLRDVWRQCVDDGLWRQMFSERMDDQLSALHCWKQQAVEQFESILQAEVLDLVLKWLTWILFNSNTQVWKLVLEVLSALLHNLAAAEMQLTEREQQILVPNIVERSGHNISAIRETMSSILRQCILVCPRLRILPMLLHGLTSKSKRSACCSLKAIGDALDRPTAVALLRSQKDLALVLKMTEDKDAEIRKAAVHVAALFSLHLEEEAFSRLCRGLPAAAKGPVRAAVAKLTSADAATLPAPKSAQPSSLNTSVSESPAVSRRASANAVPQEAEARRNLPAPAACTPQRTQRQRTPSASPAPRSPSPRPPEASLNPSPCPSNRGFSPARVATSQTGRRASAMAASPMSDISVRAPLNEETTRELSARLVRAAAASGKQEEFVNLCSLLADRAKAADAADTPCLAEALCAVMLTCFDPAAARIDRCGPLLNVLDEFCAARETVKNMPMDAVRRMLLELLKHLENAAWSKRLNEGQQLLRKLNLSCVMLLNGMTRTTAYNLLLDFGQDEKEVVSGYLVVKCLRKLNKNLSSSRSPEQDAQAILELVYIWLEKASEKSFAVVSEGVKEVVEAAALLSAEAAKKWSQVKPEKGKQHLLKAWLTVANEKENAPLGSPVTAPLPGTKVDGENKSLNSPCRARNASFA